MANDNNVKHLPEHGPLDENGREILLSLKNVDITFGKGDNAVKAVKNASFDIYKGETFSLVLTDSVGAKVEVEWVASEEGYVSIDGSKIKGVAHTQDLQAKSVTVSCTVEEETYSCIIRVYAAEKQETTENG